MAEEKRSYVVVRPDGFIIYTRPITYEEAVLLYNAYYDVPDRAARAAALGQWGDVIDLAARRQWEQQLIDIVEYYIGTGVYADPYIVRSRLEWVLNDFGWQTYKSDLWWLKTEIDAIVLERSAKSAGRERPPEQQSREGEKREEPQGRERGRDSTDSAARADGSSGSRLEADVLRGVIWPWSQAGGAEAVIVRRGRAEDEVGPALADGSNAAETGEEGEEQMELAAGEYEKARRRARRGSAANREKSYADDAEALPA
mgnify:CR=1 FL=1